MDNARSSFVCCLDEARQFKHFKVPHEVFVYIKQLECYIENPQLSKIKEVYNDRFKSINDPINLISMENNNE